MAESHVISALTKKHTELVSEVNYYKTKINKLVSQLDIINASIFIFDPEFDTSTIRTVNKHQNRYFARGEARKIILDMMRERTNEEHIYSTHDICEYQMKLFRLSVTLYKLLKIIKTCLKKMFNGHIYVTL